jgi:hypothetical protein
MKRAIILFLCLLTLPIVAESRTKTYGGNPDTQDVAIQDQTTPSFDLFFIQAINAPTALSNAVEIDDTSLVVDSVANFSAGNYLGVFSPIAGGGRFLFAEVISVVGNTITIDSPIDFAYGAGSNVISTTRELNVNGAGTSQTFNVRVSAPATISVDITRVMIQITTDDPPAFDEFGDIVGGLINGVVLRRANDVTRNIWNVKTNSEFANLAYDMTTYQQTGPQAVNGIAVRYTFSGQDKHGVTVRLEPGDSLELIIQDDLSSLNSFRVIAQGHLVDP